MPTLPFYSARPVNTAPSSTDTGTSLVTQQFQPSQGDRALGGAAVQMYQTRQALRLAEKEQHVTSRALALQNQLKTAELQAAASTGSADEYLQRVKESTDQIWSDAYEGLDANQSRLLAPKIEALKSVHDFGVAQREIFKRRDNGRAETVNQETSALQVFRNPDSSPFDRAVAQANYFEGLDHGVNVGWYPAEQAATLKQAFSEKAAAMDTKAAEDAFVNHYAQQITDNFSNPLEGLKQIERTPGTAAQKQALRNEVEDRYNFKERFQRQQEEDYAGSVAADIIADPTSYTARSIAEDDSIAGRFKDDLGKLRLSLLKDGTAGVDNESVLQSVFNKMQTMSPMEFGSYNFLPEFVGPDGKPTLTPKTMNQIGKWQSMARAANSVSVGQDKAAQALAQRNFSAFQKQLGDATAMAFKIGVNKGKKGDELNRYAGSLTNAIMAEDNPAMSFPEALALSDSISADRDVDIPKLFTLDVDGPYYAWSKEQKTTVLDDAKLDDWPDTWHAQVTYGYLIEQRAEAGTKFDKDAAVERLRVTKMTDPAAYRALAKRFLATELEIAPE